MIERGTFGSIKEFSVLEYIYEYYDKSEKIIQTNIRKTILDINYIISQLECIEDFSFKARTAIIYKENMKEKISNIFLDLNIRDRLLNFCYAKFNNIINDARKKAFENKNKFKINQRLQSKKIK